MRDSYKAVFGLALAVFTLAAPSKVLADNWLPVDATDLAMKEEARAPGAAAIYLYREVVGNDVDNYQDNYVRIKVLSDEGKKYGDIEIPYDRGFLNVTNIQGRTIHSDGKVIPWQGKALDKILLKAHGVKILAKTFTLPDIEPGSVIEYKYRITIDSTTLIQTTWYPQEDLFTRKAQFSLKPYGGMALRWTGYTVKGQGQGLQMGKDHVIHLDLENVAGLNREDFMPPEDTIRAHVSFFYTMDETTDGDKFWKAAGKQWFENIEKFIGRRKALADEVARVTQPGDPPETKLRKLYARTLQLRYLSYEHSKSEQEQKRENLKDNNNVEDVLKNNYAYGNEINWFFLALAREAGFDADPIYISSRNRYFFDPGLLDKRQMNGAVVGVKVDGKDRYFDPAAKHTPFGLMVWPETGVQGIRLDKDGGTFITTTQPESADAVIQRTATLELGDDGFAQGKLAVTFSGQEALRRRQDADDEDDVTRRKELTDEVMAWLPPGATLALTNQPDWEGADAPLRAEFDIRMRLPGASTGRRVLLTASPIANLTGGRFDLPSRSQPVYFDYPSESVDDITIRLPLVLQVSAVPAPVQQKNVFAQYEMACEKTDGGLHCRRHAALAGFYFPVPSYPALRGFFENVKAGDEQQIILEGAGRAAN